MIAPCCPRQIVQNDNLKTEDVRLALSPYLRISPSDGFCKKVKIKARALRDAPANGASPVGGEHRMGQLENYLEALDHCGWHTKLFTKSGAELKLVLIQKAKEEFEKGVRRRQETEAPSSSRSAQWTDADADYEPQPEPAEFEAARVPGLRAMLDKVIEGGRYFYGFVLIPPWAAHVLEKCAPKAIGVDGGHCSEEQKGVILEIVASDANRQNVSLAVAHFVDNESDRVVDPFFAFATEHLAALNHADVTLHADGARTFRKARKTHMPHAKALLCEKHAKDNILEKVKAPGAGEKYGQMVNATNSGKYNYVRTQAPPALLQYLEQRGLPEAELFLAPFAEAGGKTQATLSTLKNSEPSMPPVVKPRTTSAFVESAMNANKSNMWGSIRHSTPTDMAQQMCEKMVETNAHHKAEAQKCKTSAPPKVMRMLGELDKTASAQSHCIEPIGQQRDLKAKVYPNLLASKALYNVAQLPGKCTCGLPDITGFPCVDLVMLARKAHGQADFTTLLQESDTSTCWQMQYNFDFASCLPATAVVFVQPPTDLLFPVVAPKPSGAPKRARHKSGLEQNTTKTARKGIPASASPAPHTPTATSSQPPGSRPPARRVYHCRHCGAPKKGHVCKAKK